VPADQELLLIFGALHLMALVFGGLLLVMFFRSESLPAWRPPEDDEDGPNGGDDGPGTGGPVSPGGPPLERSEPAHAFRLPA